MSVMKPYYDLMNEILEVGRSRDDRTGTGTIAIFARQLRFDLTRYFPLLTLKAHNLEYIIAELIWFIEGSTNNKRLQELGCPFWLLWAIGQDDIAISLEKRIADWNETYNLRDGEVDLITKCKAEAFDQKLDDYMPLVLKYLAEANVPNVDESIAELGDLGPIYGEQWRRMKYIKPLPNGDFGGVGIIDQLQTLIDGLKKNPKSRRHIVDAWTVGDLPDESISPQENVKQGRMSLAPCHPFWQCFVEKMTARERLTAFGNRKRAASPHITYHEPVLGQYETEESIHNFIEHSDPDCPTHSLSLHLTMRSLDTMVGTPANIASYSLLTHLLANECGFAPKEFILSTGDTHIYGNHIEFAKEMMQRSQDKPDPTFFLPPEYKLSNYMKPFDRATIEDVKKLASFLGGYDPHPFMKLPLAK